MIYAFVHEYRVDGGHVVNSALHRAVDKLFLKIRGVLIDYDAMPLYRWFEGLLSLAWGLNCRFPKRDVIQFVRWWLFGAAKTYVVEGDVVDGGSQVRVN